MRLETVRVVFSTLLFPLLASSKVVSEAELEELAAQQGTEVYTIQLPLSGPDDEVLSQDDNDYIIMDEDDEYFANDANFPNEYYYDDEDIVDTAQPVPRALTADDELADELEDSEDEDGEDFGLSESDRAMCEEAENCDIFFDEDGDAMIRSKPGMGYGSEWWNSTVGVFDQNEGDLETRDEHMLEARDVKDCRDAKKDRCTSTGFLKRRLQYGRTKPAKVFNDVKNWCGSTVCFFNDRKSGPAKVRVSADGEYVEDRDKLFNALGRTMRSKTKVTFHQNCIGNEWNRICGRGYNKYQASRTFWVIKWYKTTSGGWATGKNIKVSVKGSKKKNLACKIIISTISAVYGGFSWGWWLGSLAPACNL